MPSVEPDERCSGHSIPAFALHTVGREMSPTTRRPRLRDAYDLTLLPQTFLITRDGRISWQQAGTIGGAKFTLGLEAPKGRAILERVLAEPEI